MPKSHKLKIQKNNYIIWWIKRDFFSLQAKETEQDVPKGVRQSQDNENTESHVFSDDERDHEQKVGYEWEDFFDDWKLKTYLRTFFFFHLFFLMTSFDLYSVENVKSPLEYRSIPRFMKLDCTP